MKQLSIILLITMFFSFEMQAKIAPIKNGNKYSFQSSNTYLEVDASVGARISSFKVNGSEILCTTKSDLYSWGSTFWVSPQSQWKWSLYGNWPPPASIDNLSYSVVINDSTLILTSAIDPGANIQVRKTITANETDTSYTIQYTVINKKMLVQSFAPWEDSRVPLGGMSYFPVGNKVISGNAPFPSKFIMMADSVVWYTYSAADATNKKVYADGKEGWTAHLRNKLLFVKQFPDILESQAAPSESEIEEYISTAFIELENQGAYTSIPSGDSIIYTVKWFAREIPDTMETVAGNPNLLRYTRNTVGIDKSIKSNISRNISTNLIVIFPNPAHKEFFINGIEEDCALVLHDIYGRIIYTKKLIFNKNNTINVNDLPGGIYLYTIKGSHILKAGKIILK